MISLIRNLRNRHYFILDVVALAIIPFLALILRLDDFSQVAIYSQGLLIYTLLGLLVRLVIFWRAGLYERLWRYASIDEMVLITLTVFAASVVNAILFFVLRYLPFVEITLPRSIPFIDAMLTILIIGGTRISARLFEYWSRRGLPSGKRVLIIGAGNAGVLIAREIQNNIQLDLDPVGFVDDDERKHGAHIHGIPVLGGRDHIPELVSEHNAAEVLIAIPSAPGTTVRDILTICQAAGVRARTILLRALCDPMKVFIHIFWLQTGRFSSA